MSATGADTSTSSTPSFIAALVTGAVMVAIFSGVFLLLHGVKRFARVYQSRRYLAPDGKKPVELPKGILPWWKTILFTPDEEIIRQNGVDAYFMLRYMRIFGIYMLLPYFLLTFIILIPVSAASPNAGASGLNKLTFGNVATTEQNRHIAHFLVAIILIFWTLYLIWTEYNHLVQVRQNWLSTEGHLSLARTRTVMLCNIDENSMSDSGVREIASQHVPSERIGKIWLARKVKPLEKVYDDRNKECARLEGGEAKLLALATKNVKKNKTPEAKGLIADGDLEKYSPDSSDALIDKYVLPKKRPHWKQGLLGLIGTKQDLKTSPEYIAEKNAEIGELRTTLDDMPKGNVAWIRFASQADAHTFARLVNKPKEMRKLSTSIEVVPEDIQWGNTSMSFYQRKIRTAISWALTIGLIIVWAIPVAFVGIVSNVDALCETASWMAWLCKLPSAVEGIIKGILPPVLLAILFMLLPIVLRKMIVLQGTVRKSDIEVQLFSRFWLFQVIHGFLIVTLASGLISALSNIKEELNEVPTLLATKLPSASIFFLTFVLSTSFSAAAKAYSRAIPAAMTFIAPFLAGKTPRKYFAGEYKMMSFPLATTWPPICLLICLAIVYSCIQPVITLLTMVAFMFFYASYKYLLGWCADQGDAQETGGLYYPRALKTVFVSLYIEEVCLAGLLFLSTDDKGDRAKSGLAGGVLMVVTGLCTIAAQVYFERRFSIENIVYSRDSFAGGNTSTTKLALHSTNEEAVGEGAEFGATTGTHPHAFDHPATYKAQPIIWICDDSLGIAQREVVRLEDAKVAASCENAHLDADGHVSVDRSAPDEPWFGNSVLSPTTSSN